MNHYVCSLITPFTLVALACTDTASDVSAPDAASTPDTTYSATIPSKTEDDIDGSADDRLEIGPPKGPLGNCDVESRVEGISSHAWCSRELQVNAVCNAGECIEAQPDGLPSEPPKPPPTTPPAR